MMVSELTVVVKVNISDGELAALDRVVGLEHDRHYEYAGRRDVIYYVPEGDIDRVGARLDANTGVYSYNFNDPFDDEEGE